MPVLKSSCEVSVTYRSVKPVKPPVKIPTMLIAGIAIAAVALSAVAVVAKRR